MQEVVHGYRVRHSKERPSPCFLRYGCEINNLIPIVDRNRAQEVQAVVCQIEVATVTQERHHIPKSPSPTPAQSYQVGDRVLLARIQHKMQKMSNLALRRYGP